MQSETVFKAMADGTRRRILKIVSHHELSVSELVSCLRLPQSTVSRHLKVLRDAGLIQDRRDGTTVIYAVPERSVNGGETPGLEARLLDWVGEQELPSGLAGRLDRVLDRRKHLSDAFFSRVGQRWDQMRLDAFGDAFHLEALTALLPSDWRVADIGSGTGYLLPILARTFKKVVAVDPVPEMLATARARCAREKLRNVSFRKGDLSRLPIPDDDVDLALAVLVIHHVPSPAEAVQELHRAIRPGGKLLIVEQQAHHLEEFHERMQDRWWGFVPEEFAQLVSRTGFTRVRHRNLEPEPLASGALNGPGLFVLTAVKKDRNKRQAAGG